MLRAFIIALAAWLAVSPAFAACTLPTSVANEVGRGQVYSKDIPELDVLGGGVRHYMWANNSADATLPPPAGLSTGLYVPSMRSPSAYAPWTGRGIAWYRANQPTYIVYRPDHKTPAWQFCFDYLDDTNCDGDDQVSLAIWDTAVQTHIMGADVVTGAATGNFKSVSADNADVINKWYKAGTCSINPGALRCEDAGGTWTTRYEHAYAVVGFGATSVRTQTCYALPGDTFETCYYVYTTQWVSVGTGQGTAFKRGMQVQIRGSSGAVKYSGHNISTDGTSDKVRISGLDVNLSIGDVIEATWAIDRDHPTGGTVTHAGDLKDWLSNLRTYVNGLGLCLTANMTWRSTVRPEWRALASVVDIVYEEAGFSSTDPESNEPGGGVWHDGQWIDKVADYLAIAEQGVSKPFVMQASNSQDYLGRRPRIMHFLATYLLLKDTYSYISMSANGHSTSLEDYEPMSYWTHGAASAATAVTDDGIYYRLFANGLVLLNPSSSVIVTYNLGASVYHTNDGLRWTGVIDMPPKNAYLLQSGAPSGGFVLTH